MEQVMSTKHDGEPNPLDSKGLCLLALDGGGVRGLSSLYILRSIMDRLNHDRKKNSLPSVKPCEVFDLIGGTSTGGLIAIMLGRLKMDVDECIAAYTDLAADVFGEKLSHIPVNIKGGVKPRFDSARLESAIKKVITQKGVSETDLLNDGTERGCRTFVCMIDRDTKDMVRLRSYSLTDWPDIPATICQAGLATSAATTFFDPVSIDDRTFADGGFGANNPVDEVEGEASNIWGSDEKDLKELVKCFISIGTGNPGKKAFEDGMIKFLSETVVQIATETEATEKRFIERWAKHFDRNRYFRFNVDQGLQDIGLDEFKKKGAIKAATEGYLTHVAQRHRVRDCIQNLRLKQNKTETSFGAIVDEYTIRTIRQQSVSELTEEEKECLRNLFITDPEEDMNALKRRKGNRTSGTCSWFLESDELRSWSRGAKGVDDIERNVLWLYGNPGTGKSTMAIMLAEELPKEDYFSNGNNVLSYFFCEASSENQRKATSILRGLLYQIINQYPRFIKQMMSKYDVQKGRLFTSFDALWAVLMDIGRVPDGPEIYCIVDALDECEAGSQEILLQQIYQSFGEARTTGLVPSSVHMLITSRKYPELEECLSIFRCLDLGSCKEMNNDLKAMIRDKVKELARRKRYPKSIAQEVSQILEEKADGTFLWVGIACGELGLVQSRNAVKTLQDLPRGLHSLYQNLLGAAVTASNPDDYQCIKEMLTVVTFALRPLTMLEIAEACRLYLDEDMGTRLQFTQEIIDLCRLLIVVDNGYVRLLHRSVQDFLMIEVQEINATKSNYALSCRCIEVILQHCRPDMDRSMLEPNNGFLGYSVLHWPEHASLAQTEFTIRDEHEQFFQDARGLWRCWLDNYNYLKKETWGGLGRGLSAIHVAARWGIIPLISSLVQERLEDRDAHGQSPLLVAAENAQLKAMRLLIESGACVNSLNNEHQNVLHIVCKNGCYNDCRMTEVLLHKGASPYVCDKDNMTPFLYTIGNVDEELTQVFLQNGFDLKTGVRRRSWPGRKTVSIFVYQMAKGQEEGARENFESGLTALHFSALNACTKMTAFLLQCGADPNARSDFGDTALHLAIRGRLLGRRYDDVWQTGKYAVESLTDLITDQTSSEASDINRAIDQARIRIVETLFKSETIDVNMANNQGEYPQHLIDFGKYYALSTLDKLVEKGADTSRLNQARQTCLHLASIEGNLEVVRKLVDEGHDILLQDVDGLSPFHYALHGGRLDVLHFMSETCDRALSGIWRSLDHFGKTPLHHHVSSVLCSAEVRDFLVQLGCDVNEFDTDGNSSLGLYMGSSHLFVQRDVFFLLVQKGADPLWVNRYGQNLAHRLMHYRGADNMVLGFLFDIGLDPGAKDLDGKTFMHHGAIHGAFTKELVEFLHCRGVLDLHATDSFGKTPLDYAEEQAHREVPEDILWRLDRRREESFKNLNTIILCNSEE